MKEQLSKLWNDPRRPSIVIGLVAFNSGVGLGYFLARRRDKIVYTTVMPNMNDTVLDLAKIRNRNNETKIEGRSTPSVAVSPEPSIKKLPPTAIEGQRFVDEALREKVDKRSLDKIIIPTPDKEDEELVTRSIFVDTDDWNYEEELKKRSPTQPYVIHKDEFYSEESGYTQSTLTYYAGDDILCDEDSSPIYNHDQVTGPLLFGHGSGDKNVVHIRNDKRKAEYEIVYDSGLYTVEVLGLEIEENQRVKDLKHSKQGKFRPE